MLTQGNFQCWLELMEQELSEVFRFLPATLVTKLNFSIESLSELENWLLSRYASNLQIISEDEKDIFDRSSRYVGETIIRQSGGNWEIDLEDEKNVYYRMPVVRTRQGAVDCPFILVTANLDRRRGDYIMKVVRHLATAAPQSRRG